MNSLRGVFPILERPPPLLELLDGLLGQAALLKLAVQILNVQVGQLLVGHAHA